MTPRPLPLIHGRWLLRWAASAAAHGQRRCHHGGRAVAPRGPPAACLLLSWLPRTSKKKKIAQPRCGSPRYAPCCPPHRETTVGPAPAPRPHAGSLTDPPFVLRVSVGLSFLSGSHPLPFPPTACRRLAGCACTGRRRRSASVWAHTNQCGGGRCRRCCARRTPTYGVWPCGQRCQSPTGPSSPTHRRGEHPRERGVS